MREVREMKQALSMAPRKIKSVEGRREMLSILIKGFFRNYLRIGDHSSLILII